jgi:hypothetical protein
VAAASDLERTQDIQGGAEGPGRVVGFETRFNAGEAVEQPEAADEGVDEG